MIHLEADQEFFAPNEYRVCNTGDYGATELVEVYKSTDYEKISCVAFQSTYIATGICFVDIQKNQG